MVRMRVTRVNSNMVAHISILFEILTGKFLSGHFNRGRNSPDLYWSPFFLVWSGVNRWVFSALHKPTTTTSVAKILTLKFYCLSLAKGRDTLAFCFIQFFGLMNSNNWIMQRANQCKWLANVANANVSAEIDKLSRTNFVVKFSPILWRIIQKLSASAIRAVV